MSVDVLVRQAEDYAAAALGGVLSGLEEDPRRPNRLYRRFTELMLGLEVHFLFPNLAVSQRRLLASLVQARNALVLKRGAGRGGRTGSVASWERKFRGLRTRAKALGRSPDLTALQREVLERVFLSVTRPG